MQNISETFEKKIDWQRLQTEIAAKVRSHRFNLITTAIAFVALFVWMAFIYSTSWTLFAGLFFATTVAVARLRKQHAGFRRMPTLEDRELLSSYLNVLREDARRLKRSRSIGIPLAALTVVAAVAFVNPAFLLFSVIGIGNAIYAHFYALPRNKAEQQAFENA